MLNDYTLNSAVLDAVNRVRILRKVAGADCVPEGLKLTAQTKLAGAEAGLVQAAKPYLQALGVGTAAAAPLVGGGALLVNKAKHDAEDVRNKALLGALGVGGSLVALNNLTRPSLNPAQHVMEDSLIRRRKISAALYLSELLGDRQDAEGLKLAAENNRHLADMVIALIF